MWLRGERRQITTIIQLQRVVELRSQEQCLLFTDVSLLLYALFLRLTIPFCVLFAKPVYEGLA